MEEKHFGCLTCTDPNDTEYSYVRELFSLIKGNLEVAKLIIPRAYHNWKVVEDKKYAIPIHPEMEVVYPSKDKIISGKVSNKIFVITYDIKLCVSNCIVENCVFVSSNPLAIFETYYCRIYNSSFIGLWKDFVFKPIYCENVKIADYFYCYNPFVEINCPVMGGIVDKERILAKIMYSLYSDNSKPNLEYLKSLYQRYKQKMDKYYEEIDKGVRKYDNTRT